MDEIDRKILTLLQENSKISYNKLAKKLELATSTVYTRVKNLEKEHVITQYSVIIDHEKAGLKTIAILGLNVDPLRMKEIAKKLANLNNVLLVAITTGDHDLIIQIIATDERELWRIINEKIKPIEGIKSQISVSSFIEIYKRTHLIDLLGD
jgi:Lrp/AsnC family transcriptional regulator for asnA, asnC and gidA